MNRRAFLLGGTAAFVAGAVPLLSQAPSVGPVIYRDRIVWVVKDAPQTIQWMYVNTRTNNEMLWDLVNK